MKRNHANEKPARGRNASALKNACRATGRKILAQIARARAAIFAESFDALPSQERLLRLVLNEAEVLAWQTRYPHLLFPVLATEKIQAVAGWNARQCRMPRPRTIVKPSA